MSLTSLYALIVAAVLQPLTGTLVAQTSSAPTSEPQSNPPSAPNPKYGDDTPESAIRSFYTAIAMADRDTVEFILTTPKELENWIDTQLDITYAFHRFSEAAKSHFGEEGKALYMPSPALFALKQLKEIKPKETDDKAEWTTNPRLPTKLIRKDGHWKIDLAGSFEKPEHIQLISQEHKKTADLIDAIAEEIEGGQYDTIPKVRAEIKRRRETADPEKPKP